MTEGTLKHLSKLTRTKLIEEAHNYPDIVGAHGLSKEQLIEVLSKAKKESGEWIEEPEEKEKLKAEEKVQVTRASLKQDINALKKKRDELLSAGDRENFVRVRARLNRLKGKLRRLPPVHRHPAP